MRKPLGLSAVSAAETLICSPARLAALPGLTGPLLRWYGENARDLPWRREPAPYRVWVSEVMLQQTRVEAARGYFERFVAALPTVADLAAVSEDTLLKLWEGLGYYSRARNLRRAAQVVMAQYGGALPASYAALLTLPGVGEYTAGAVASIAFGIPVPAVDGNVCRVLSRLLASPADISRPAVKAAFREAAASLLPDNRPGDLNQALMELGATVCLPGAAPLCGGCPLAGDCAARESGDPRQYPVRAAKKPRRVEERTVLLVLSPSGALLFRRAGGGLLSGLYEPVNREGYLDAEAAAEAVRALGGNPRRTLPLTEAKHIFSHVEWHMRGYLVYTPNFDPGDGLWAGQDALTADYALPSAFRAFFRDIGRFFEDMPEGL